MPTLSSRRRPWPWDMRLSLVNLPVWGPRTIGDYRPSTIGGLRPKLIGATRQASPTKIFGQGLMLVPGQDGLLVGKKQTPLSPSFPPTQDYDSAPLYRSAPLGPAQPAFLNTAVCIALADGQPSELIATLLELERMLGRTRATEARWGPRRIDLDVLVWAARIVHTPELEVPHPRLAERKFALAPLCALLGEDYVVPGLATPAGELVRRVAAQDCEELAATW